VDITLKVRYRLVWTRLDFSEISNKQTTWIEEKDSDSSGYAEYNVTREYVDRRIKNVEALMMTHR